MRRVELSEVTSNLLLASSVMLAFLPFLLGDRLILIVTSVMKESSIMMDQLTIYLMRLGS
jgi:hypothetical protein